MCCLTHHFANKSLGGYFYDSNIMEVGTYFDDILEFDPLTGQWKLVDRMKHARGYHAMGVVSGEVCN